jgi:hypothetical protein
MRQAMKRTGVLTSPPRGTTPYKRAAFLHARDHRRCGSKWYCRKIEPVFRFGWWKESTRGCRSLRVCLSSTEQKLLVGLSSSPAMFHKSGFSVPRRACYGREFALSAVSVMPFGIRSSVGPIVEDPVMSLRLGITAKDFCPYRPHGRPPAHPLSLLDVGTRIQIWGRLDHLPLPAPALRVFQKGRTTQRENI